MTSSLAQLVARTLRVSSLTIMLFSWSILKAQCPWSGRFFDSMYQIDSVEVVYTQARQDFNKMDVFFPQNDNTECRPLLLLIHGGGFNSGDKHTDAVVNHLCRKFAERGYVTASIQYRLTAAINLLDSVTMMKTVLFALYDAKAAVRYFVKMLPPLISLKLIAILSL